MIALCLGGAKSVWGDLQAAKQLVGERPHIVVACNYAGIKFAGHIDAWVTFHPEWFANWRAARAAKGFNTDYRAFAHKAKPCHNSEVVPYTWFGSSGLYMAQVAFDALKCTHAILCGVPMDDTGEHIQHPGKWSAAKNYRDGFLRAKASGANIRSMSGWSAELFGKPTEIWLDGMG